MNKVDDKGMSYAVDYKKTGYTYFPVDSLYLVSLLVFEAARCR